MNKTVRRGVHLLIMMVTLLTICCGATFIASAERGDTFTVDDLEYTVTAEGTFPTVKVADCPKDYEGDVNIPETIENPNNNMSYAVTSIANGAFSSCEKLKKVTIPNSVTSIGISAFDGCGNLESVTIGNSVTKIRDYAFNGCGKLHTIYSYAASAVTLGNGVFYDCPLEKIYIPYGTKDAYIEKGWSKDKLEEKILVVFGTVTNEEGCRMENANVTLSYKSGGQIKTKSTNTNSEGYYEFVEEYAESEYTIEIKKVGYIDYFITSNTSKCDVVLEKEFFTAKTEEGAVIRYRGISQNLDNKTGTVAVSRGPGPLYEGNITLTESVKYDGITYTITSIDKYAFIYHEKLGTITIPSNVEYIDDYAFSCCGFNKMIVNRETPPELGEGVFSYSTEFELVVPSGSEGDYKAAGWPI